MTKIKKSDDEWKEELTPEQFDITRRKGTEDPFTGEYDKVFDEGEYHCVCCGATLFESDTKYDAGCGWPSFTAPVDGLDGKALEEREDDSITDRPNKEVVCSTCDAHLGHVFSEEPTETGVRYCINSAAIKLEKK